MDALSERMEHFGLTLHPDKTRLLPFRRPPRRQEGGKGRATFDFLGFTFYWTRTRKGRWAMTWKTRSASLRRFVGSVYDWCRRHRHLPVAVQHKALKRRIQGHFNYFGVSGNFICLLQVIDQARRGWYKWLCRGHAYPRRGANASVSPGSGSRIYFATFRSRSLGSWSRSGTHSHKPRSRRSRMVEEQPTRLDSSW